MRDARKQPIRPAQHGLQLLDRETDDLRQRDDRPVHGRASYRPPFLLAMAGLLAAGVG
jgi:hypothetical protein